MKEELLSRIAGKQIVVGVVGLGYVGLPLAVEKAKAGFKTIGFDVQADKVKMVNEGHNYIGDVVDAELTQLVADGMLSATTDFSFVKDVDFIAICVLLPWMHTSNPTSAMWNLPLKPLPNISTRIQWSSWNPPLIPEPRRNSSGLSLKKVPDLPAVKISIWVSLRKEWIRATLSIKQKIPPKWWAPSAKMPVR